MTSERGFHRNAFAGSSDAASISFSSPFSLSEQLLRPLRQAVRISTSDHHMMHPLNGAGRKQAVLMLYAFLAGQLEQADIIGDFTDHENMEERFRKISGKEDVLPSKLPQDIREVLKVIDFPGIEEHLQIMAIPFFYLDHGVECNYFWGNHDAGFAFYNYDGIHDLSIQREGVYHLRDGFDLIVQHGDYFDPEWYRSGWMQKLETHAGIDLYTWASRHLDSAMAKDHKLLKLSEALPDNALTEVFKSFAERFPLTEIYKRIGKFHIGEFKRNALSYARDKGKQGVLCGHIHKATIEEIDGMLYCNDGDGLTHGSLLAKDTGNELHIIGRAHYNEIKRSSLVPSFSELGLDQPRYQNKVLDLLEVGWKSWLLHRESQLDNRRSASLMREQGGIVLEVA